MAPMQVGVKFQGSRKIVDLSGEVLTYGDRFEIEADSLVANDAIIRVARNGSIPTKASSGSHGAHGANGAANSANGGGRGGDGTAGGDGDDSFDVEPIVIRVREFSGTLTIDNSGATRTRRWGRWGRWGRWERWLRQERRIRFV